MLYHLKPLTKILFPSLAQTTKTLVLSPNQNAVSHC